MVEKFLRKLAPREGKSEEEPEKISNLEEKKLELLGRRIEEPAEFSALSKRIQ